MSDKPRFPRSVALSVARELAAALKPVTERLLIVGSVRRRKQDVGDIELLFIPKFVSRPVDLFGDAPFDLSEEVIAALENKEVLVRRQKSNGAATFGPEIKLMRHVKSCLPVDFFSSTDANWFNLMVCRTGPMESNVRICDAAIKKGWHWNPYSPGFWRPGEKRQMNSERDVFEFVGLKYQEPWNR